MAVGSPPRLPLPPAAAATGATSEWVPPAETLATTNRRPATSVTTDKPASHACARARLCRRAGPPATPRSRPLRACRTRSASRSRSPPWRPSCSGSSATPRPGRPAARCPPPQHAPRCPARRDHRGRHGHVVLRGADGAARSTTMDGCELFQFPRCRACGGSRTSWLLPLAGGLGVGPRGAGTGSEVPRLGRLC